MMDVVIMEKEKLKINLTKEEIKKRFIVKLGDVLIGCFIGFSTLIVGVMFPYYVVTQDIGFFIDYFNIDPLGFVISISMLSLFSAIIWVVFGTFSLKLYKDYVIEKLKEKKVI